MSIRQQRRSGLQICTTVLTATLTATLTLTTPPPPPRWELSADVRQSLFTVALEAVLKRVEIRAMREGLEHPSGARDTRCWHGI